MDQKDSPSPLSDNLLALPRWAVWATLGLLALGVASGFTFLIVPNLNDALRSAGGSLLVISLPALALSIGLLGGSWARTERIDAMTARYLYHTVGNKLESHLVGQTSDTSLSGSTSDTPLFVRMERRAEKKTTSFCYYSLFDDKNRRFDIFAKSNVFNFEIAMALHLDTVPATFTADMPRITYQLSSQDEWPAPSANPLVDLVSSTLYGSLSEGYSILIDARIGNDGVRVVYQLRQKLQSNFLTSPYLRRYFAEDAAIACHALYEEAFANTDYNILDGELD
jgi:hypothetical protein